MQPNKAWWIPPLPQPYFFAFRELWRWQAFRAFSGFGLFRKRGIGAGGAASNFSQRIGIVE